MRSGYDLLKTGMASRRHLLLEAAPAFSAPFPSAAATSRWLHSAASGPPVAADLSALFTPAKHQGDRFTCAYFAVTAAIEAVLARDTGQQMALSEEYLAQVATIGSQPARDETTSAAHAIKAAQSFGMVAQQALPYRNRDQPAARPAPALLAAGQRLRVNGINAPALPSVDTLIHSLGRTRTPVIISLKLPADHAGWQDDGLVTAVPTLAQLPAPALAAVPNHIITLTGYDRARQMFFFKNSWGPHWGRAGYGRIGFATMASGWWTGDAVQINSLTLG
jgi:hypothetical protein